MDDNEIKEALRNYNPAMMLVVKNEDPKYLEFLKYYWSMYGDEMKAAFLAHVDYGTLELWRNSEEYIEHKKILDDHRIQAIESNVVMLSSGGDSRSSEFVLSNKSETYKKKKAKEDNDKPTLAALVSELQANGAK